jgi:hypothetical protein
LNQRLRALNELKTAFVDSERKLANSNNELHALDLRKRNDADLPPEETAGVRGQIRELNYWLSLQPHSPPAEMPSGIFE